MKQKIPQREVERKDKTDLQNKLKAQNAKLKTTAQILNLFALKFLDFKMQI